RWTTTLAAPSKWPAGTKRARSPATPVSKAARKRIARNRDSACSASALSYSGSAGRCFEKPCRLANSASSSCSRALSRSRISESARVRSVAKTGPRKASRTSTGSQPEWSRCACVSNAASIDAGATGNGDQLRWRSFLKPWNSPQSTSSFDSPLSSRKREPVTVSAAPRKVSFTQRAPARSLEELLDAVHPVLRLRAVLRILQRSVELAHQLLLPLGETH